MLLKVLSLFGILAIAVKLSIAAEGDKGPGTSNTAAGSTAGSPMVNCNSIPQTPSGANDTVKAIYDQIREYCAQLQLRDVTAQLNNAKAREIAQALGSFTTIQGPTGKITNADKANHVAEWYAKKALFEAAAKAGTQIAGELKSGKFVVITDPNFTQNKPKLVTTLSQLKRHSDAIAAAASQGNAAVKEANVRESDVPPGARIGIVPLLTVIPPAITAVQSLANLFRETSDFSALTLQSNPHLLVAGLGACLEPGVRANVFIPQYANTINPFVDAYDRTQAVVASARQVLQNVMKSQAALDAKKGDSTASKRAGAIAAIRADLEAAIKNFEEYDKFLQTASQAGQPSLFENLVATAASGGDAGMNYIVLYTTHFGANSGTVTRFIGSDKLEYMATAQVTYLLINPQGALLRSTAVPIGVGSSMTVSDTEKGFSTTSDFQCPK
jgi:hypothetical protein